MRRFPRLARFGFRARAVAQRCLPASSSQAHAVVRREVPTPTDFDTVFRKGSSENPRQRESMPSPQLPASITEDVISHDRWFLDRIAAHILAFEGDSHVEWFEGNYEDYEKDKKRRLGVDADQPHRIKYRKLDA